MFGMMTALTGRSNFLVYNHNNRYKRYKIESFVVAQNITLGIFHLFGQHHSTERSSVDLASLRDIEPNKLAVNRLSERVIASMPNRSPRFCGNALSSLFVVAGAVGRLTGSLRSEAVLQI